MNRIVEILMRRDGVTKNEAEAMLREARQMARDCSYDPEETEEIMYSELGLELDYVFDLL